MNPKGFEFAFFLSVVPTEKTTFSLDHHVGQTLPLVISFFGGFLKTFFMHHQCQLPSGNFLIGYARIASHCTCHTVPGISLITHCEDMCRVNRWADIPRDLESCHCWIHVTREIKYFKTLKPTILLWIPCKWVCGAWEGGERDRDLIPYFL